jgi:serine/threonine protein kinase
MSKMVQDYMLMDVIGSGQYGKVWKAQHVKTREAYAIKAISIQEVSKMEKLKEFVMSEINALELMSSSNIVKYYGKLQTTNNIYLIFEFCRGGTLEDMIKKEGMLPESRAMAYFDQILSAFAELRRLNIMHRDLKPSNILIDNGEAKLADFGFCKRLNGEFDMTKSIVGSPIYMAPELLQGRYYCAKADIWSLGVVLYEMLHGKCPYEENSIPTLLEKIKSTELRIMPGLALETRQLLEGLLAFNPSSRTSWSELLKLVHKYDLYKPSASGGSPFTNLTMSALGDQSLANLARDAVPSSSFQADQKGRRPPTVIPSSDLIRQRSQSRPPAELDSLGLSRQNKDAPPGATYGLREAASTKASPLTLRSPALPARDHPDPLMYSPLTRPETLAQRRISDDADKPLEDALKACPFVKQLNARLQSASISQFPLAEMRQVILSNKRNEHEELQEILKNRYCVKFIMDKIKMFYLLDFEDLVWQSHMVLLLFKKARKYMLTAKIKASYADLTSMKSLILEPQQLIDYIESETSEFEQLYSQFLKEAAQIAREEAVDRAFSDNVDKPFDLDDGHFFDFIKKTVLKITTLHDENSIAVANALLDVYTIDSFLVKLVDFREKEKHFENFNNRLTNRELRELVSAKLDLIK